MIYSSFKTKYFFLMVHFHFFLLVQICCVMVILMLSLHPRQTLEIGEGAVEYSWTKVWVFFFKEYSLMLLNYAY